MAYQAVLITGAPASGKSTLLRELKQRIAPVREVEFGRLIAAKLKERGQHLEHTELRSESARVIRASDVAALDTELVHDIRSWLSDSHVIIASHAVTHEDFGVRVTPFSQQLLGLLPLSAVVVLEAPPDVLVARVKADARGRVWNTVEVAQRLQTLQTSLGLMYGVMCGCPVYVFDSDTSPERLAESVLATLRRDQVLLQGRR